MATRPQATVQPVTDGTCFRRPAATVPRRMIPAHPATLAAIPAGTAVAAAMAEAAIEARNPRGIKVRRRDLAQRHRFRLIPMYVRYQFGIA